MARPVEEEHLRPPFEQRPQGQHLVLQIGACAVNEDDWRQVGVWRGRHMHIVNARAIDLGEFADRRVAPLDHPRAHPGQADEDEEQREQEGEGGVDQVHRQGNEARTLVSFVSA